MEKQEITSLHDLMALGIRLHKQNLPNGFIVTVWSKKENREKIYKDLLDNDISPDYWKVEGNATGCYNFKILGINFLLF